MDLLRQSMPEQEMLNFNTGIQLRTPSVVQLHQTVNLNALKEQMGKRAALKNLGLVFDDGKNVYLIQKTGKVANPLKPEPSHILITKATEGPGSTQMVESAGRALNTGELATEWTSTLLSCGGAIVGTGLIITGGIALPLTGGASIGVVALAYGGTGASWLQCGRGGYRLFKYRNDGDASFIDRMNADESDVALGALLDVVSLASAGGALRTAINTYRTLKAVSSRSALDWLKGMSRAERRRLSAELAKQSGLSKAEKLLAIQSGSLPKTIASSNIQKVVAQEMLSATAAAMAMGGSAVAGVVRSPRINATAMGKYMLSTISGY